MFAVLRTGGKQYQVKPGSLVEVELLAGQVGDPVSFNEVLLVADGESVTVGRPTVDGASISGEIVAQTRGPKAIIFKKIRRQGHQKKKGHRQSITKVRVKEILTGS